MPTKRIDDPNVWRVYGITLLIGCAYGLAIAVVALWLDKHHFEKTDIGTLAAWFAGGIMAGSIPAGWLVRRVGGKRVLVTCIGVYAAVVGTYAMVDGYEAIAALRAIDGAVSVGVWVSSETILLARARKEHKAFVMSLYAIAIGCGYVLGPLGARGLVAILPLEVAFVASAVLAAIAAAVAAATLQDLPHAPPANADGYGATVEVPGTSAVGSIVWRIKASCFATFAYGYFQATVVLFLPLFMRDEKHVAEASVVVVPAFFAAGLLAFSNVAGRLGDRLGHLGVMRVLALVGGSMVLAFVWIDAFWLMAIAVFVAGGTLATISPVSLGLQGAVVDPADYGRANGIYNAFYAGGMLVGPPISSWIMRAASGGAMLIHLAVLWGAFVLFTVVFWKDDPAAR